MAGEDPKDFGRSGEDPKDFGRAGEDPKDFGRAAAAAALGAESPFRAGLGWVVVAFIAPTGMDISQLAARTLMGPSPQAAALSKLKGTPRAGSKQMPAATTRKKAKGGNRKRAKK